MLILQGESDDTHIMPNAVYAQRMLLLAAVSFAASLPLTGCGSGVAAATSAPAVLAIAPATAVVEQGSSYAFRVRNFSGDASACAWQVSDAAVLAASGAGTFVGTSAGSATVTAVCGGESATSSVAVTAPAVAGPIRITTGGTYSGTWSSNDPAVPAVTIATDQPVTLRKSTVSGKGTLIFARGVATGVQLTVTDVSGIGLDPGVAGLQRGRFLDVANARSVSITHTTMTGVSFGIVLGASTLTSLTVTNNLATNLDDRASDGKGGLTAARPALGHFLYLNAVTAPNGGEIAWNQVVNTPGSASVEDLIDLYNSRGSAAGALALHDNYLQGAFAPSEAAYTGAGITTDGPSNDASTATGFVDIRQNQVVHTANVGIAVAAGHDIAVSANRVVSCGQDAAGTWYATGGNVAIYLWNYSKTTQFYNNSVSGNGGGLLGPDKSSGQPVVSDIWAPDASVALHNTVGTNAFTDPCLVSGVLNIAAEGAEYGQWTAKLAAASQTVGVRR